MPPARPVQFLDVTSMARPDAPDWIAVKDWYCGGRALSGALAAVTEGAGGITSLLVRKGTIFHHR